MYKLKITELFPIEIQNVISALRFPKGRLQIEGSASSVNILYPSDIDLFQYVDSNDLNYFKDGFQTIIRNLLNLNNVYIGDIKIGEYKNEPLRWKPIQILEDNNKNPLVKSLAEKAMIKIDVVVWNTVLKAYTEISCIYQLIYKDKSLTNYNSKKNKKSAIREDLKEFVKEKYYFKALKRLYSLEPNKNIVLLLEDFFNSEYGLLYQIIANIDTMIFLLENHYSVPKTKLETELKNFNEKIETINRYSKMFHQNNILKLINILNENNDKKVYYKNLILLLTTLRNLMYDELNIHTYNFIIHNPVISNLLTA